jgi:transposase
MANRGTTACGTTIVGRFRVSEKKIDEGKWWTLGVDHGEERHRFVVVDDHGERQSACWVENRRDKIEEAVAKIVLALPEGFRMRLVTEGVRSLGWVVAQVSGVLGIEVWQVNPKALKHYRELEGQPRKDDDIDAYLLARMVFFRMGGCRVAVDHRPEERAMSRITRHRKQVIDRRTVVKNRLRSLLVELVPEVLNKSWEGPVFDGKGMRAILKRWPTFEGMEKARASTIEAVLRTSTRYGDRCGAMVTPLKEMASRVVMEPVEREVVKMDVRMTIAELEILDRSAGELKEEIIRRVQEHPVGKKLLAMPGEGPITVGTDIGEVLPVARNVSEGKAATYAGLTPLSRLSGKGGSPSKLARGVNKHAVRTNYLSAIAATSASAIDAAYHRKQKERHQGHPKPHVKATLSLARQRFKVKYKLMTTDAVYDKETLIKSHLERQQRERENSRSSSAA